MFRSLYGNVIAPNFMEDCKKIHEFKRIYEVELEKPGSVLMAEPANRLRKKSGWRKR
jgi:hypothetical protein